jgi:hypothetical protein
MSASGWVTVFLLVLLFIFIGPVLTIYSLNTLFHLNIEFNFATYASATWLTGLFTTAIGRNK